MKHRATKLLYGNKMYMECNTGRLCTFCLPKLLLNKIKIYTEAALPCAPVWWNIFCWYLLCRPSTQDISMSKGGRGAGANVLMIKKAGNKRHEMTLREAFKVSLTWFGQYDMGINPSTSVGYFNIKDWIRQCNIDYCSSSHLFAPYYVCGWNDVCEMSKYKYHLKYQTRNHVSRDGFENIMQNKPFT